VKDLGLVVLPILSAPQPLSRQRSRRSRFGRREWNGGVRSAAPPPGFNVVTENVWVDTARRYDRNDKAQLALLLVNAYETIKDFESDREVVARFAQAACMIGAECRVATGIDLFNLTFPYADPPLPPLHPLFRVLRFIDQSIKGHLNWLAGEAEPQTRALSLAPLYGSLTWKGYAIGLNTLPEQWGTDTLCALKILRILSTTGRETSILTARDALHPLIQENVRADDWPPREFMRIYFANQDQIAHFQPVVQLGLPFS
jgi:hypothetical protein